MGEQHTCVKQSKLGCVFVKYSNISGLIKKIKFIIITSAVVIDYNCINDS